MKKWLKRIRAAMGLGLTWAGAWAVVLTMVALVVQALGIYPDWTFSLANHLSNALLFGGMGFVGGSVFSGILGFAERRRTFSQMSLPRFTGWGAIAGLAVPALVWMISPWGVTIGEVMSFWVPIALLGAGSSAGTLALARRADRQLQRGDDPDLLEGESPSPV